MAKMTDDELRSAIDQEVADSAAWTSSTLVADRERNLAYYHGLPMGNEVEGRSQVVSWDVFEVIEGAIPSLLEPFFAGDNICEFEPSAQGDEDYADQATDYVNWLIKKKNDGFITFNTWIKDGLLSKVGIVRCWWDATSKVKKERYTGLTDQQLVKLAQDKRNTLVSHDAYPDPDDEQHRAQAQEQLASLPPEQQQGIQAMLAQPAQQLHDIELERDNGPRGARIDNVPPESFVLSRHAKKLADVSVIGELRRYTRSDLVEMGFSKARVELLSEYDASGMQDELMLERDQDNMQNLDRGEGAMEQMTLFFGFIRVDYDGDGIAEWRRVFMGGNDILENEEVDDHEYCLWSPILLPHRVIGMALADAAVGIQDIKTSLTRQYLDSLYLANNPTTFAIDNQVNLDDLLSTRIGKVVRIKQIGAVGPLQTSLVANESLQGIELANTMREERIGVTRYSQGLDAESLNKTATGVTKIMSAGERRMLMMLRVFAETGCKDLCKRLLKLTCEYQDKPATIRLRNEWVEYDPRNWSDEMDVNINVGLGTGDKGQTIQFLQMMGAYFAQAATVGVITPENVYALGKMLLKAGNIQGGEARLLTDPTKAPPAPPQKSPEQILAESTIEVEKLKQEGKAAEAQQRAEENAAKLESDRELAGLTLQIKDKEVRIKEIELGMKHAELEHRMANDQAAQQAGQHDQAMRHQAQLHGQMLGQHAAEREGRAPADDEQPPEQNGYHE
jgi:hypothetical protein